MASHLAASTVLNFRVPSSLSYQAIIALYCATGAIALQARSSVTIAEKEPAAYGSKTLLHAASRGGSAISDFYTNTEALSSYSEFASWTTDAIRQSSLSVGFCNASWDRGPIIVGGLSDSGTRGVKKMLQEKLNVNMTFWPPRKDGDDVVVMHAIWDWMTRFVSQGRHEISESSYRLSSDFDDAALELCEAVKKDYDRNGSPKGAWGFKVPDSVLLVPIWDFMFGASYKFVHVVRDPRASCSRRANKFQYSQACKGFISTDECVYPQDCFKYWARVSLDVWDFYHNKGNVSNYVYISTDRLVNISYSKEMLGNEIPKLGLEVPSRLVFEIASDESGYSSSYDIHSMFDLESLTSEFETFAQQTPLMQQAAHTLGYNADAYGLIKTYGSE